MKRRRSRDLGTITVMTPRGIGMGASGVVIVILGIGLASPVLVWIGVSMAATVLIAATWLLASVAMFRRRFPDAWRTVVPHPLSAGGSGTVNVSIRTARHRQRLGISNALASALDVREQAAAELTGGLSTKATVGRSAEELRLDYQVHPSLRGRWPLGPALVKVSEPLGMMWADVAAGSVEHVPVWPRIIDLTAATGALMGQADQVVLGARMPSADDSSLRDYRDGDDLRRVHWKSTARRGTMVVRADERAGVRPATVLLDLPVNPVAAEWSISAAASVAVSVLASGHPVRLIGSNAPPEVGEVNDAHNHDSARSRILNATLDLEVPLSRENALDHTRAAVRIATHEATQGEVVIAVCDPLADDILASLVPLGESGRAWAIVRNGDGPRHDERAENTAATLNRSGWKVVTASVRDDLASVWTELVAGGSQ
ncbi:DUF58 domain-containing protein [Demequina aurantiaca]|uniref:DUF58 domain-containing protein n=1 Tax=Demequina aurantiaca TaxID=676200 RepID=UPI0007834364|nr:DUF58 domain-containing protein [Demequina aurantiaca]